MIGTHTAWSTLYPVYEMRRPDLGLRIILRKTSHWRVSVTSTMPVTADLSGLCKTKRPSKREGGGDHDSIYFEGFPSGLVFGYYEENREKFSATFDCDHSLWAALFLILSSVGAQYKF